MALIMEYKPFVGLFSVFIVNWIAECASFRTERKSVAAARSGTKARISSMYPL